ncbi:MAG TPA: hypothetical protein VK538_07365 [Solirubrobacteraceae bacterium]|nr:hypothetical protein [Solirubrobacteraceae bacterium]
MAKTWILDSETKGTGAHIAPLDGGAAKPRGERDLSLVKLKRAPAPTQEPASPEPLRFKVVDVMSAHVLGEDVDVREAVGLLEGMHSVLDARIFVRSPGTGRWRLLGLDEQKAMWHFRGRAQAATL